MTRDASERVRKLVGLLGFLLCAPGAHPQAGQMDLQQAMDSPDEIAQIPLRMTAYVLDETLPDKANTAVVAEVEVNLASRETDVDWLLVLTNGQSRETFRYEQKADLQRAPSGPEERRERFFPIVRQFELAPGPYRAKLAVRDPRTGRLGTVAHDFEVPDRGQLRTSSVVLSDTLQPALGNLGTRRPTLIARRTFQADSTLFGLFAVFGAAQDERTSAPRVSSGYVIRDTGGVVRVEVAPRLITPTPLGGLSRVFGSSLKGLPPADYDLVVGVRDEVAGKALEIRERFTVVAGSAPH